MKNKKSIIYIVLCLFVSSIPFTAMTFAKTDTTTENKKLSSFPALTVEGKLNTLFFEQLDDYFNDHFAFRNILVNMDSIIQGNVFQVSNMDTVIKGTDGWLYYKSSLDDYLGINTLSSRGIYNAVHNLSLMQDYVENKGSQFVLTIAPNKNSLYGENMPDYYKKVSDVNNIQLITPYLKDHKIKYADLLDMFKNTNEVLYLKRDSHWNQKGALIAYNSILDAIDYEHDHLRSLKAIRTKEEIGDLNKMIYPVTAKPEWNYQYQYKENYKYITDTKSVEDAWIETENSKGNGKLLMFRDSFGNTLLPFMANTFQKSYFSKGTPYQIESYFEKYTPELVIVEKVERNIDDFAKEPPIMSAPEVKLNNNMKLINTKTMINVEELEYDPSYWKISGYIDKDYVKDHTNIFISIDDKVYEAFTTSNENNDNQFVLYMKKDEMANDLANLEVIIENDNVLQKVKSKQVNISKLSLKNK